MSAEVPMARAKRMTRANYVYHVLNRGAKKALLFAQPSDYRAFQDLLRTAKERVPCSELGGMWNGTHCERISF